MNLIKSFSINNLYGEKNIHLIFNDKTTIYVGENGIGKTTVLTILYYTLSNQIEMLEKYDFDSIKIKYNNNIEITFTHDDLSNYTEELKMRRRGNPEMYARDIARHTPNRTLENLTRGKLNRQELDALFKTINLKSGMPHRAFDRGIEFLTKRHHYSDTSPNSIIQLLKNNEEVFHEFKILYFPTYRRIEEDVSNLKIAANFRKENEFFGDFSETEKTGELIQFGMNDVKEKIDSLLNIIKNNSIDSFNKMTSKLLNQYLEDSLDNAIRINQAEKATIEIALNRVGAKISEVTRRKILKMYDNQTLSTKPYLANLVMNIVENYHSLKSIDERIENFVDKSNRYLYNKKMVYNPSEITLDIFHNSIPDKSIPLEKLSSGEKQLLSTFSKVFLEDTKKLIILFDEPELSLSIDWQKDFIFDLSNSDNCELLIAVTHSPFIFDKLFDETYELEDFITEGGIENGRD